MTCQNNIEHLHNHLSYATKKTKTYYLLIATLTLIWPCVCVYRTYKNHHQLTHYHARVCQYKFSNAYELTLKWNKVEMYIETS